MNSVNNIDSFIFEDHQMEGMFQRPSMPDIETDYIVIGAGLAGLFSAIELRKKGKEVWVLGSEYESQLAKAGPLRQVTSIPEGTIGIDYILELMEKAKSLGVNHKSSVCTGIVTGERIEVSTKHQKFIAKHVIIATGAKQAKLGFEGEMDFLHKGISDCTVCDFGLFRGKNIAVLGNHEYTWRASKFMVPHVNKVYLLWYDQPLDKINDKVEIYSEVTDLVAFGSETLEGVKFSSNEGPHELSIDGLFVEGKPIPATDFLKDSPIDLDENGYVKINVHYETSVPSIYAVGDVTGKSNTYESVLHEVNGLIKAIL